MDSSGTKEQTTVHGAQVSLRDRPSRDGGHVPHRQQPSFSGGEGTANISTVLGDSFQLKNWIFCIQIFALIYGIEVSHFGDTEIFIRNND